ncbi:Aste57867_9155 [Aphanomyces stellatus]|uniref:Aste57867_9155 protein n=1 Tax=Aphanomyces stellatus TaxID=120398 RepID=A0A485KM57_9STRA|nr:hypothetical protein As57867_009119 [Aphanomyces stellatus]VFT86039.1 Aste57867_9155 [Aphanomyces stellatus]
MLLSPVYPRMVLQASTADLEDVIQTLHTSKVNSQLPTQYCYVDYDERFELAHTRTRQRRCAASYNPFAKRKMGRRTPTTRLVLTTRVSRPAPSPSKSMPCASCLDWSTTKLHRSKPCAVGLASDAVGIAAVATRPTMTSSLLDDVAPVHVLQFALPLHGSYVRAPLPTARRRLRNSLDLLWLVVMLDEWAALHRKVVLFEGDVNSIPLLSKAYDYIPLAPNDAFEIPRRAGRFFDYAFAYVSITAAIVAVLMLVYGIATSFRVLDRNLLHFNRLVSSAWVGRRVLVVVRGLTAIVVLSTSAIRLDNDYGLSRFQPHDMTCLAAPLHGSIMDRLRHARRARGRHQSILILRRASQHPPRVARNLWPRLRRTNRAHTGALQVGSSTRVALVGGLQAACVAVSFAAAAACRWTQPTPPVTLLMSVAAEVFLDLTLADDFRSSSVDKVTCVMAGLLVLDIRGHR